jgi:soluble lytic murein transglycosylase
MHKKIINFTQKSNVGSTGKKVFDFTDKRIFKLLLALIFMLLIMYISVNISKNIARRTYPLIYKEYILDYAKEYNVDPYLIAAVIKTESNFKEKAASRKNAKGLMQLMDDTSKWIATQLKIQNFNLENVYDPELNIKFGTWYLSSLAKEFNGDISLMLAAYNGGRGNVKSWLNNPEYSKDGENLHYIPFKETDKYNIYKYLYPKFYICK